MKKLPTNKPAYMIRSILLFAAVVLASLSIGHTQTDRAAWEKLTDFEGRFSLLAPGAMQQHVDTIATELGDLAYYTFVYQTREDTSHNVVYMLSYCDYPTGSLHHDSTLLLEEFFAATMEEAVAAVRGELLYQAEANYDSYPGRQWRIHYLDGKAVIKTRALVIGRRYYAIQTISLRERSMNRATERFIKGLRIFPPEPAADRRP